MEDCPICLHQINPDTDIVGIPILVQGGKCSHQYHFRCINEWAQIVSTCPKDRGVFQELLQIRPGQQETIVKVKVHQKPNLDDLRQEANLMRDLRRRLLSDLETLGSDYRVGRSTQHQLSFHPSSYDIGKLLNRQRQQVVNKRPSRRRKVGPTVLHITNGVDQTTYLQKVSDLLMDDYQSVAGRNKRITRQSQVETAEVDKIWADFDAARQLECSTTQSSAKKQDRNKGKYL